MKKLFSMLSILSISLSVVLFSCESDEAIQNVDNQETNIVSEINAKSGPVKFKVYFATWDEWGRSSKDCKGWGLCNYTSCWFCCIDENEDIVDCNTSQSVDNSGTITINPITNLGHLVIELNPSVTIQNDAIVNQKTFYIDNDIITTDAIVHKGDYSFDSSIGLFGGYSIDVTQLK
ncbi:hypothetical protein DFQ11_1255 [Winogradskyella epiphytica]|uniref:Lipoprotein n=2 Tax=Winogradskyella epiphytica TaxID=262005 RepID=A0A2V4WSZ0_9FLAO|nr:hypothetical protein DFQ11_1255 [Winogradskyella epiphytica]|tara:strand:- start:80 stop:607 length:528 start_codon:yes stop_codon:yes gene_type:complete